MPEGSSAHRYRMARSARARADAPLRVESRGASLHNRMFYRPGGQTRGQESAHAMKTRTKHRKSYKWRKKADSSPVAKGRRPKRHGVRNPRKLKHLGGEGLK